MSFNDSEFDRKEIARRGDEVFERQVRPLLQPEDEGKFVAIDINSGAYEVDADDYTAVMRLRNRVPAAEIWLVRAGHPAAYHMRAA